METVNLHNIYYTEIVLVQSFTNPKTRLTCVSSWQSIGLVTSLIRSHAV